MAYTRGVPPMGVVYVYGLSRRWSTAARLHGVRNREVKPGNRLLLLDGNRIETAQST